MCGDFGGLSQWLLDVGSLKTERFFTSSHLRVFALMWQQQWMENFLVLYTTSTQANVFDIFYTPGKLDKLSKSTKAELVLHKVSLYFITLFIMLWHWPLCKLPKPPCIFRMCVCPTTLLSETCSFALASSSAPSGSHDTTDGSHFSLGFSALVGGKSSLR